jgi:transposase
LPKSPPEIMEILASYDLTRCAWSAAELAGCDPKTVRRYVELRDAGRDPLVGYRRRAQLADAYVEKIEEWVELSRGKIRADVAHKRLQAMGYGGSERTTRRAVRQAKTAWHSGHRRSYRPWVPEPGGWLQFDWGEGPRVGGRRTNLFCAWLSWSRYRVVLPTWDRRLGTLLACLDATLRRLGGAPTYLLTDNERTVTTDRVAGVPVRHPVVVAAARHYGLEVRTCVVADPESKGGAESTVRLAKADLVPTLANLLEGYTDFGELAAACERFCAEVNGRRHTATGLSPAEALSEERRHLHVLPNEPYTAALGETRTVEDDQTVRFGSVRYSTPPGWVGRQVWCGVEGEELVIVGAGEVGLQEVWRHQLSIPGRPRIVDEHYPNHPQGRETMRPRVRPQGEAERTFLAIGPGAEQWLRGAAGCGTARVRTKMAQAVELAALYGPRRVDEALGLAATSQRFGENDLVSILANAERDLVPAVHADERYSVQPGTGAWQGFGLVGAGR